MLRVHRAAALGLTTDLYDAHVEPRLLRQLLSDVPGGFGGGCERSLQRLQLLGLGVHYNVI